MKSYFQSDYFLPDCLYKETPYRKLIPFYELGVGVNLNKKRIAALKHDDFLSLCSLVKELMVDKRAWSKYNEWSSKLHIVQMKLFVHENLVRGFVIAFDKRISEVLIILRLSLQRKKTRRHYQKEDKAPANDGENVKHSDTEKTILTRRIFPKDDELEREFDRLLNRPTTTILAEDATPMLRARQQTVIEDVYDQGHDEISRIPQMRIEHTEFVLNESEEPPPLDEVRQPAIEEAAINMIPSHRDRAKESNEDESAEKRRSADQSVIAEHISSVPALPPITAVQQRLGHLNPDSIITYEEYEETLKVESAAKKTQKKHILTATPVSMDQEVPRYRPPVFGEEESSDDEPGPMNIIVCAEVHAPPASSSDGQERRIPHEERSTVPAPSESPAKLELTPAIEERTDLQPEILPPPMDDHPAIQEPPAPSGDAERERERVSKRRHSDVTDPTQQSSSPPTKKRKWGLKYRYRYHMSTLKKKYNRTTSVKPYISPLEELELFNVDRKPLDLYHLMYTFNDYRVNIGDVIKFREDGSTNLGYDEIYQNEPTWSQSPAPMWVEENVVQSDGVEACDEEQIVDLLRDVANFEAGRQTQIWQILKDDLMMANADQGDVPQQGRKSSVMGVWAQRIRQDMPTQKQTLLPDLYISNVPTTRVSDLPLPELQTERTEEAVQSARIPRRELLAVVDPPVPVVEQAIPEPVPTAEQPEDDRHSRLDRRASGERIDPSAVIAIPDGPRGIREEIEALPAIADHQLSAAPHIEVSANARPRETLADVAALPTSELGDLPPIDSAVPANEPIQDVATSEAAKTAAVSAPAKAPEDETSISEKIWKGMKGGVFIGTADPTLVIPSELTALFPDRVDWDAPIRQIALHVEGGEQEDHDEEEEEEIEDEESRSRTRVSRRDVEEKLSRLLNENAAPVRFSSLCAPASTTKYVAARTFYLLLNLHYEKVIRLETDSARTDADAILIYPMTNQS